MVSLDGLGPVKEPTVPNQAQSRDKREHENRVGSPQDSVEVSTEAQAAAGNARLTQQAALVALAQTDRVAAAKARIESGHYKRDEVVSQVAARISSCFPET
jgi:anti-sigma28 factor (negative regulator of flagellin synthesis)